MHKTVLLLGSNLGNSKALILKAKNLLEVDLGTCILSSSIYISEAWGFETNNSFLNQVLVFETDLKPKEILYLALDIETKLGRERSSEGYSSRTMDIDLLFYDQEIMKDEELEIPHPKLHLRRFTLEPLSEIMPEFIHPVFQKTMHKLLVNCTDNLSVTKLKN
ncbi:MAG: 2-amino-4-hydroxy-6-hydroxymethyldihydropteridine diphosphokinase [Bacteroidales bacterium]|nr:2-amino-4-hydroxy-6-hydroxymethyldihydropteridine diphosphokinase [Bacteroidales bacterium]